MHGISMQERGRSRLIRVIHVNPRSGCRAQRLAAHGKAVRHVNGRVPRSTRASLQDTELHFSHGYGPDCEHPDLAGGLQSFLVLGRRVATFAV